MDMDGARGAPFATGDVMDLQHYLLLLVGSVLVNNVVLVRILGLCPFMGVSKKLEASLGMGIATTFVLTLACAMALRLAEAKVIAGSIVAPDAWTIGADTVVDLDGDVFGGAHDVGVAFCGLRGGSDVEPDGGVGAV